MEKYLQTQPLYVWNQKLIQFDKLKFTVYVAILLFCFLITKPSETSGKKWKQTFPRLIGMNIGAKNYHNKYYQQELAKLDIVVLGFYRGWNLNKRKDPVRTVIKELKNLNENIKIGQYTKLNSAYDNIKNLANLDRYEKLYKQNWWLKDSYGNKILWSSKYNTWRINFTHWTAPDSNGRRYTDWLAQRDYLIYFEKIPELDIWYFDNVMWRPRTNKADWDLDGKNDPKNSERIQVAFRQGHAFEWEEASQLAPNVVLIGNTDNDLSYEEYKGKLQGAFLEALMGKSWSIEKKHGWEAMMERYRAVIKNTSPPHIIGFNVWGNENDFQFFRYAFTSCLLDNGYFSFTSNKHGYSSVPWFDEYDVDLGIAIEPPIELSWKNGIYKREFEKGVIFVNPGNSLKTIKIQKGYKHFIGSQDRITNDGSPANIVKIPSKDGIILIRAPLAAP